MPSYPSLSGAGPRGPAGLASLLRLRLAAERRAEVALASTVSARGRAQQRQEALSSSARAARAELAARRSSEQPLPERAREALLRERFWARCAARATDLAQKAEAHRRDVLAPAAAAEHQARSALVSARAQREAVETLIARREAAARRLRDRREEAG